MSRNKYAAWINANPLRKWRLEQGLSMMAVASILGAGMSTVQTWETGAHWPKPDSFAKIGGLIGDENIEESWKKWMDDQPAWVDIKKPK
jgi:predicted transcriptional regulator